MLGRARDLGDTDTVDLSALHLSRPSAVLPILNEALATGSAAVELMESDVASTVISGPALVMTLFTGDSGAALPQRLTACTAI